MTTDDLLQPPFAAHVDVLPELWQPRPLPPGSAPVPTPRHVNLQPCETPRSARLLAVDREPPAAPAELLPSILIDPLRDIGISHGIGAVDYGGGVGGLVEGTMNQQGLPAAVPRPVTEEDTAGIFAQSIALWYGGPVRTEPVGAVPRAGCSGTPARRR